MQLRAEVQLEHARIATIAKGLRRTVSTERTASRDPAGSGASLVRIKLEHPSTVKERPAVSSRITITPAQTLEMQLDFAAEQKEAGNIAYAARASERRRPRRSDRAVDVALDERSRTRS